jgi:predicted nucleotidyltransferase
MEINSDFEDLLSILNDEGVKYLVVGGYAVIAYTEPRYTKDIDLWISADPANARRIFRALARFGAPLHEVTVKDFATPGLVFQIGVAPVRVDVLMSLTGVDFAACWKSRTRLRVGGVPVNVIALDDLIANKKAVARPEDLLDVQRLELARALARSGQTPRRRIRVRRRKK